MRYYLAWFFRGPYWAYARYKQGIPAFMADRFVVWALRYEASAKRDLSIPELYLLWYKT